MFCFLEISRETGKMIADGNVGLRSATAIFDKISAEIHVLDPQDDLGERILDLPDMRLEGSLRAAIAQVNTDDPESLRRLMWLAAVKRGRLLKEDA